jgi:hypothetical protein
MDIEQIDVAAAGNINIEYINTAGNNSNNAVQINLRIQYIYRRYINNPYYLIFFYYKCCTKSDQLILLIYLQICTKQKLVLFGIRKRNNNVHTDLVKAISIRKSYP